MTLSPKKRIVLNVIATYGRSLYSLACGLLTASWTLLALGEVCFGLYGVVGGLTEFVALLNGVLASSIGRFYAYAVGEAHKSNSVGLENCRKWFNTAITIHTIIPFILIITGYPIGVYAIKHCLTIPAELIGDCIWVWRFACCSCFLVMICVPFNAMYTAKQYIAELTIYSFFTTTAHLIFVYYMHCHPGNWLVPFAAWQCFLAVVPQIIIAFRACKIFQECRFIVSYMFNIKYLKQIFSFSLYNGIGGISGTLRNQGVNILTNIYFGPALNAAINISNNVVDKTAILATSVDGALMPVVTNECGASNLDGMRKIAMRMDKLGPLFILFFGLPIILEISYILKIWLKNPPQYTAGLVMIAIGVCLLNSISTGQMVAVNANGNIRNYQLVLGGISLFTIPVVWIFLVLGASVYIMQSIVLCMVVINTLGRVFFAQYLVGMSAILWLKKVFIPITMSVFVAITVGYIPHFFMEPSFFRLLLTAVFAETVFIPFVYFIVLDCEEKVFLKKQIQKINLK